MPRLIAQGAISDAPSSVHSSPTNGNISETRSPFMVLCTCVPLVRTYVADVDLLALLIVGHAVIIPGLVGLVCCGSGLGGVVRCGDVGPSNSSSMFFL